MVGEQKSGNQSLKIQLSLASLMFFSPFIRYLLQDADFELENGDKHFVKGYITLGWFNIVLFIGALVLGSLAYFSANTSLLLVYQIVLRVLLILLLGETLCAIAEIPLIAPAETTEHGFTPINYSKKHILQSYLPGYNIYLWYRNHAFDTPDPLLKESLLFWGLFTISCIIPGSLGIIAVGFLMLLRVITLLTGISLFPATLSSFLASLFYKHPEEVWAYIWGLVKFLFQGKYTKENLQLLIENTKKEYQYLYDIHTFGEIHIQIFFLFVSMIIVVWQVIEGNLPGSMFLMRFLILLRYGIMVGMIGRIPDIPLMREIGLLIKPLFRYFTLKK